MADGYTSNKYLRQAQNINNANLLNNTSNISFDSSDTTKFAVFFLNNGFDTRFSYAYYHTDFNEWVIANSQNEYYNQADIVANTYPIQTLTSYQQCISYVSSVISNPDINIMYNTLFYFDKDYICGEPVSLDKNSIAFNTQDTTKFAAILGNRYNIFVYYTTLYGNRWVISFGNSSLLQQAEIDLTSNEIDQTIGPLENLQSYSQLIQYLEDLGETEEGLIVVYNDLFYIDPHNISPSNPSTPISAGEPFTSFIDNIVDIYFGDKQIKLITFGSHEVYRNDQNE